MKIGPLKDECTGLLVMNEEFGLQGGTMSPRHTFLLALFLIGWACTPTNAIAQCDPSTDCNQNGVLDQCDIDLGSSDDCNGNLVPDECDIAFLVSEDCNLDGIPDECNPGLTELVGLGLTFGQGFGDSIDSSADFAVIGAPQDDLLGTDTGSANIFRRSGTQWIEEMKLFGIASTMDDMFGTAVAIEDDLVAIGAPGKMQSRGAVFLFRRVGTGWWNYEATITAFDAQPGWLFGTSIEIENGHIVVGAPMNGFATGAGAVYLFSENTGQWMLDHKLTHSDGAEGDRFGASLQKLAGRIAVGAPGRDSGAVTNSGAAVVYEESAGIWLETAVKTPSNPQPFGLYGSSIALNQDHLLVGAPGEDVDAGAAYIYDRLASMWVNPERFIPDAGDEGNFGHDVSLSVRLAVVSSPLAGNSQGTACIYRREGNAWMYIEDFLPVSLQEPGTEFGKSISCEIPFLLVGCPGELYGESVWINAFTDCNLNLEDDVCDVTQGLEEDCNLNRIPDSCEINEGSKQDCDGNGVPDECQILTGELLDCNFNGVPDGCDITQGFSLDCNQDGVPDDCQSGADPFNPVISNLPDPISVETEAGLCGATIVWNSPTATDDCGIESLTSTHQPGEFFAPGLSIVTYTATDVSGNQSTAMFTVLVHDQELPTLAGLQPLVSVQAPIDTCEAAASWALPTASDNCGVFNTSVSHLPGTIFPVGSTTVTYTVMDVHGNTEEFLFEVEVLDNHMPEILGISADIAVSTDPDSCTAIVNWAEPTPQDDCVINSFLSTHASGDQFPIGVTDVTYTVSDSSGLTTTESFSITVTDDQLPQFASAPASINVGNDPDDCGAVVTWVEASISDNCAIDTVSSSHQPGDHFGMGTTQVTITALDVNGNSQQHSFDVTVTDTQSPELTGVPSDITLSTDPSQCSAVHNWVQPDFADNCGVASFNASHQSGFAFPMGQSTVEYTVTDLSGNTLQASFAVIVIDAEMPALIDMPLTMSVANDNGQCGANVSWTPPVVFDNCAIADFDASHQPGAFFPIGTTTVNYAVMDGVGQITLASFDIVVDDQEAPVFNGMPADRTVESTAGLCSVIHEWTPPVAADNCTIVSSTATHQPGDIFNVGTTEVVYSATDSAGMVTTDQFLITVIDTELPTIIRIPADIAIPAQEGVCTAVAEWIAPDSQDNCGISFFTISHDSGSTFPIGDTQVTISTEDLNGNDTSATFIVTVLDQQEPAISGLPADIDLTAEAGVCSAVATWIEPTSTDNCSVSTFGPDLLSGHRFDVGTTPVTYTSVDSNGNLTEATFLVTITDDEVPQIENVLADVTLPTEAGLCGAAHSWVIPAMTDNCAVDSSSASHAPGDFFPHGLTTVQYSVVDTFGNTSDASFVVSVVDLELPVISGMPQDVVLGSEPGQCGASHQWVMPTAADNCQVSSFLGSHDPGNLFPVGSTTVSYTAQDATGNLITASFDVTVEDVEAPTLVGVSTDILMTTEPGLCTAVVSWIPETSTDNCGILSHASSRQPGEVFDLGTNLVEISVIDVHGNESTASFNVTVEDAELPQITNLPLDIEMTAEAGLCGALVSWVIPTDSDNCSVASFSGSALPDSFFNVGTTPVTYSITDGSGNSAEASFLVTITDDEAPQIENVLADVTLPTEAGLCGAAHSWAIPALSDNCGIVSTSASHEPGHFFDRGVTTVIYSVTDTAGLTTQASFNVTVNDLELPLITNTPVSVVLDSETGVCGAVHQWLALESTDNCGIESLISSHASGEVFPIGDTSVSITAQDSSGNTRTDSFIVTVNDVEAPELTGFPQDIVTTTDPGNCNAVVSWVREIPTDNCGVIAHTSSHLPGDIFEVGIHTVTVSAEDLHGNTTTQQFQITIVDEELPVISNVPADFSIITDAGQCGSLVTWIEPSAVDNCMALGLSSDTENGAFLATGTHVVTYSVTDPAGNLTQSAFTVTVEDSENPVFTSFPLDLSIDTDPGQCGAVVTWDDPTTTDNCQVANQQLDVANGAFLEKGTHIVTGTVEDTSGNITTQSFTVTISDNELPEIIGLPADMSLTNIADTCGAIAEWTSPVTSDNCPGESLAVNFPSGTFFAVGTNVIRYVATDSSGNINEQNFNVVVTDDQAPAIVGVSENITIETDPGVCTALVSWIPETSTDNCGVQSHTSTHQPGEEFGLGLTTVAISVIDLHGNESNASFEVNVIDLSAPQIVSLPADITITTQPGVCGSVVSWTEPTAIDNCQAIGLMSDISSGSLFDVGSTLVTYTVEDPSGNVTTESFQVVVTEDEPPALVGMPTSVTIFNDAGVCGAVHEWIEPTSTDNCQVASQVSTQSSGDLFSVGITVVTYTTTDAAGNETSDSFQIEVLDQEDPVLNGLPLDATISVDPGNCSALYQWVEPTPADNCGIASVTVDISSGSVFPLGLSTVSYTTTDINGNMITSQFTVDVIDDESPTISGVPTQVLVNNLPDQCGAIASWDTPVAADNCQLDTMISSHENGSFFETGETVVEYIATDAAGNLHTASFSVHVMDIQIPTIIGLPNGISVSTDTGACVALVNWDLPFALDNCGMDSLTTTVEPGSLFTVGVTPVTYTAIDVNGNTLISNFDVTVTDNEFPQFVAPTGDIQITSEPGLCDAQVTWNEIVSTDPCGIESIVGTHSSGDRFPVGSTLVEYSATDNNGNISTHGFSVTVTDDENPVFSNLPLDITLENEVGVCGAVVTWGTPLGSDNCGIDSMTTDHISGELFQVGDTAVTYSLLDLNGNMVEHTFIVSILDTEYPVITGLQEIIEVSTDPGNCTAVVNWAQPTTTDNCLVESVMSTHTSGDVFPIGDTVVTYGVMDSAGLVVNQPFLIKVSDDELPLIENLPADMLVTTEAGSCSTSVEWISPITTDNCGIAGFSSDHDNGSIFNVGITTVVYTATDVHGNENTASFTVTVEDLEGPSITGLPESIQLDTEQDLCGATGSWNDPIITDNCVGLEVTQSHQSGAFFAVGTHSVIYTVLDSSGNTDSHTIHITVTDAQAPDITMIPADIELENTTGSCSTVATWSEPVATDACGDLVLTSSHAPGAEFPVGTTIVEYNATDTAGNIGTVSFNVTVIDTELPTITSIPDDMILVAPPGHCSAVANWSVPTAADNCGVDAIVTSFYSGMEYSVGTTAVLVVVTDTSGNQITGAFHVTVLDQDFPQIVGMPGDLVFTSDLDQCGATVNWLEPEGFDGCGLQTFESNFQPLSFFPVGVTTVTYVATDASANSVSASFTITIIDDESPIIENPVPITVTAPVGTCSATVQVPELIVTDRCGEVTVINDYNQTSNASGVYPRGNTLINWTATDDSGNVSYAAGVVTVLVDSPDCNLNGVPDICDVQDGISLDCNLDGVPDECQTDCDGDGIPDDCEIEMGTALDCNLDGYPDDCAIANGIAADCDLDGVLDQCEIDAGIESDCDQSGVIDSCEIASGAAADCNGNGQVDSCDIESGVDQDCDLNGILDSCQITSGSATDCDLDGVIDSCEIASGDAADCDGNGVLDSCDLAAGLVEDCDQNQVPDSCDLASGIASDCNGNGSLDSCDIVDGIASDCDGNQVVDSCEIASNAAPDCDQNGIIDSCDILAGAVADCDSSGVPDSCELASGAVPDCNGNGVPDSCDLAAGAADCDQSGVLDSCEVAAGEAPDCNGNGSPDSCDIASGIALDCDLSGVPDNCEISSNQVADCNGNGIPDSCDLASGIEQDCDGSGAPDSCEVLAGTTPDCNQNGVPDSCDIASGVWADCDLDGVIDSCEIDMGTGQDCDASGVLDSCEIASGATADCDGNQIPDSCDMIAGTLIDCDGNQIPDVCEIADGSATDCNGNGIPDSCDLSSGLEIDEDLNGIPDSCQVNFRRGDGNNDGIVNIADGVFLLTNLFAGGANPTCEDAADANDDGNIDVSDIITILGFQFNGTNPPPPPFDNCGVDPTVTDGLSCILYNSCP